MQAIQHLEIHLVHSCNLTCESCSHYSNQGHKGMLALEEADRWMQLWSGRLQPREFRLLGGEPTIHPRLAEFFPLARKHWPKSQLWLVTNGFFLHRHPALPGAIRAAGNAAIRLSIHHDAPEYRERLEPNLRLLKEWRREFGIKVEMVKSNKLWTRRYRGFGSAMEPFEDMDPRRSWRICPAKTCPQLFEGRIWKCAPVAYLGMQDEKHHLSGKWAPYLRYKPLYPDCGEEDVAEFFGRKEETVCGMCPAKREGFRLPLPMAGMRG